jgi:hypothetical protein
MSWPLRSHLPWRDIWSHGDSLVLLCPWLTDVVEGVVLRLCKTLARRSQPHSQHHPQAMRCLIVVPDDNWQHLLAAKLPTLPLALTALAGHHSVRHANHVLTQWSQTPRLLMLINQAWLPTFAETATVAPDRLIIIAPPGNPRGNPPINPIVTLVQQALCYWGGQHELPVAWVHPPVSQHQLQQLKQNLAKQKLATIHVATLPMDPFAVSLNVHAHGTPPLERHNNAIVALTEQRLKQGPVVWLNTSLPVSGEDSAAEVAAMAAVLPPGVEAHTWASLPFNLRPETTVIIPAVWPADSPAVWSSATHAQQLHNLQPLPTFAQWLSLSTTGLPIQVHCFVTSRQLQQTASPATKGLWARLTTAYKSGGRLPCAWQQTMQIWQGQAWQGKGKGKAFGRSPKARALPLIPACGVCASCTP